MNKALQIFAVSFLLVSLPIFGDSDCVLPEGSEVGKPIISVSPMVSRGTPPGACSLLSYQLIEKPGTALLVPTNIEIVEKTNRKYAKAAQTALSKWAFKPNNHEVGKDYLELFRFEPK